MEFWHWHYFTIKRARLSGFNNMLLRLAAFYGGTLQGWDGWVFPNLSSPSVPEYTNIYLLLISKIFGYSRWWEGLGRVLGDGLGLRTDGHECRDGLLVLPAFRPGS